MALYRNWPEICNIGRLDHLLMLVLSCVPLREDSDILTGLYVGFPQCFNETFTEGPFPLSAIRELAKKNAHSQGYPYHSGIDAGNFPFTFDALLELDIPHITFEVLSVEGDDPVTDWEDIFPLDSEKAGQLKQGDIFEWHEKKLVVMEYAPGSERITLSPLECIALKL